MYKTSCKQIFPHTEIEWSSSSMTIITRQRLCQSIPIVRCLILSIQTRIHFKTPQPTTVPTIFHTRSPK